MTIFCICGLIDEVLLLGNLYDGNNKEIGFETIKTDEPAESNRYKFCYIDEVSWGLCALIANLNMADYKNRELSI